jgi:hypothetical protein
MQKETRMVALLTDFGLRDPYVAAMKGVIASIDRTVTMVDLTHDIPAQDIAAASFHLASVYAYFPCDTVFVSVVDPGVGGTRRAVAIATEGGYFVAPDNGILTGVLSQVQTVQAVNLTNSAYWRVPVPSHTFHGRDIFAPVAAHVARGTEIDVLGDAITPDTLIKLPLKSCIATAHGAIGAVQYCDRFGNLITNIPAAIVQDGKWSAQIGTLSIPSVQTYSDRQIGDLVALIGSEGWVEIAVNCGNAKETLQAELGTIVEVAIR